MEYLYLETFILKKIGSVINFNQIVPFIHYFCEHQIYFFTKNDKDPSLDHFLEVHIRCTLKKIILAYE